MSRSGPGPGPGSDPGPDPGRDLLSRLTLAQKVQLVTGFLGVPTGMVADEHRSASFPELPEPMRPPPGAVGSDGFVPGIAAAGISDLNLIGAGCGITNVIGQSGVAELVLPSPLARAATWNPDRGFDAGTALATAARRRGCAVLLAGGLSLADPRCGRVFEYHGEEPLLAGSMVAAEVRGAQQNGVVATIKHFAGNSQETGRFVVDTVIPERALREGELLGFEIVVRTAQPGAVMTSYTRLNGTYASEHPDLIDRILKREWEFTGWVMSDWGAMHSTVESALAGLDQEFPHAHIYGDALLAAVQRGEVPEYRLDDMVRRIVGTVDRIVGEPVTIRSPGSPDPAEPQQLLDLADRMAAESVVLAVNRQTLPLPPNIGRIAVIGRQADRAVLTGGGSAAVSPYGGAITDPDMPGAVWVPSSPLAAIAAEFRQAEVVFDDGSDPERAATVAAACDAAIVVLWQWTTEGTDLPDLSLPGRQDEMTSAVAATGVRTVVVLQTGGPVLTPWADAVDAVLLWWYPGHAGPRALARILSGQADPVGRSPVTFPADPGRTASRIVPEPDLNPPDGFVPSLLNTLTEPQGVPFANEVSEPMLLWGHRWYEQHAAPMRIPFGHGLSYTRFEYADAEIVIDERAVDSEESVLVSIRLTVTNRGDRPGTEVPQVYVQLPPCPGIGATPRRLAGWGSVRVPPGVSTRVTIDLPPWNLRAWHAGSRRWCWLPGSYRFDVAASATDVRATLDLELALGDPTDPVSSGPRVATVSRPENDTRRPVVAVRSDN